MNFNIYLDDKTAKQLQEATEASDESRNAIIRRAIRFWLNKHQATQWPDEINNFEGVDDFPAFEQSREELPAVKDDPFA